MSSTAASTASAASITAEGNACQSAQVVLSASTAILSPADRSPVSRSWHHLVGQARVPEHRLEVRPADRQVGPAGITAAGQRAEPPQQLVRRAALEHGAPAPVDQVDQARFVPGLDEVVGGAAGLVASEVPACGPDQQGVLGIGLAPAKFAAQDVAEQGVVAEPACPPRGPPHEQALLLDERQHGLAVAVRPSRHVVAERRGEPVEHRRARQEAPYPGGQPVQHLGADVPGEIAVLAGQALDHCIGVYRYAQCERRQVQRDRPSPRACQQRLDLPIRQEPAGQVPNQPAGLVGREREIGLVEAQVVPGREVARGPA